MKTIIRKSWLIGVALIVAGAVLFGIGWLLGARGGVTLDRSGVHVTENETVRETVDIPGEFREISINVDYGDVELIPSEDGGYRLEYVLNSTQNPIISVKPGVLGFNATGQGSINFSVINFDVERSYTRLYYPVGSKLEKLTIVSSSGDVTISGFDSDKINIKSSYGDIELKNVSSGEAKISSSSGKIDLSGAFRGSTVINSSYGDIRFDTTEVRENYVYDIDLSYGDLRIDGKKTEHGAAKQTLDRAVNKLEISSSSGDVDVNFGT